MKNRIALVLIISITMSACLYTARPQTPVVIHTPSSDSSFAQPALNIEATPSPDKENPIVPQVTRQPSANKPNIATIIADPGTSFAFAHIYSLAYLENGDLLVTVEVPGGVYGKFFARLGQEVFNCDVLEAYPTRLYCNGETKQAGLIVPFLIFSHGDNEASFETDLGIPPVPAEAAGLGQLVSNRSKDESP